MGVQIITRDFRGCGGERVAVGRRVQWGRKDIVWMTSAAIIAAVSRVEFKNNYICS